MKPAKICGAKLPPKLNRISEILLHEDFLKIMKNEVGNLQKHVKKFKQFQTGLRLLSFQYLEKVEHFVLLL